MLIVILSAIQIIISIIFVRHMIKSTKTQTTAKSKIDKNSEVEYLKFKALQNIHLTTPLAELSRPKSLDDVIGQEDGIKALRAVICCPNPQHVIIYGPPGVGKTAAARAVLDEAKALSYTPFGSAARFVEIDAATLRFDDRGIADPLIGSVHDPIYQGAGAYGNSGIPQPKPGAVTKAHGGILFIDEIGELHPIQMNKLLKVLEDRRVMPESIYYNESDTNIPLHIHEMFKNGLPADFRLIGATTRQPEDIPPAIRSRCVEIYFDSLKNESLIEICSEAAKKCGFTISKSTIELASKYAQNGRDIVNILQTSGSVAMLEDRTVVEKEDIEWVTETGRYTMKYEKKLPSGFSVGKVSGLAVFGGGFGAVMDIEAKAEPSEAGGVNVTGIVEQEEYSTKGEKLIKKSSARESVQNMLTVLKTKLNYDMDKYSLHINFPCSSPVDGPSAGTAIFCAVYSALTKKPIDNQTVFTGEISILGEVKPVGGVFSKLKAAKAAGAKRAFIPKENYQKVFEKLDMKIETVTNVDELLSKVFGTANAAAAKDCGSEIQSGMMTAKGSASIK